MSRRLQLISTAFALAVSGLVSAAPASALESWQLSQGPFVTASDVTAHNKMPLDIKGVTEAVSAEKPDWQAALTLFSFGANFPNHSLAKFTDNYNGRFPSHLPHATGFHGNASYMNAQLYGALSGTGRFAAMPEEARAAFVRSGLIATAINWSRYELGESQRKANAKEPNWSLQNGSPKNWNEIFAFYWGPEGKHSVYEALAPVEGGSAANEALLKALADGQELLVKETWAPDAAAAVAKAMDAGALLLLDNALAGVEGADEKKLAVVQAQAAGYWLAAVENVAADADLAKRVDAALTGKPDATELKAVAELLEPSN